MSHQDRKSKAKIVVNYQTLGKGINWLLPSAEFAGMTVRMGSKWLTRKLVTTALLWSLATGTLTERFQQVRKITKKIFSWQPPPGTSYQGFIKMLTRWGSQLVSKVVAVLQQRTLETAGDHLVAGYELFAVDGSRVELPRTKSNEAAYSPQRKKNKKKSNRRKPKAGRGKERAAKRRSKRQTKRRLKEQRRVEKAAARARQRKSATPMLWVTMIWHVVSGLPWLWQRGPSDSSERGHFLAMLAKLPIIAMIIADAGFVGYEFWKALMDSKRAFLIRVGSNVRLLKNLGYARERNGLVYLWPDSAAKKKLPPLVLRLIVLRDGKDMVYLVTNVLATSRLSDRQAATMYRARWGIELFFRTFKQTFERRKLLSKSAENAALELDWSLLGLWTACLLGRRELMQNGEDPKRLSAAKVLRAVRTTMREYRCRPESAEETLSAMLCKAVLDDYDRSSSKASRDYPVKKKKSATGPPRIKSATRTQIAAAKEIRESNKDFRLTA